MSSTPDSCNCEDSLALRKALDALRKGEAMDTSADLQLALDYVPHHRRAPILALLAQVREKDAEIARLTGELDIETRLHEHAEYVVAERDVALTEARAQVTALREEKDTKCDCPHCQMRAEMG